MRLIFRMVIVIAAILLECGIALGSGIAIYLVASPGRRVIYRHQQAQDHPIDFYGVVRDENGSPVAGALVSYSVESSNPAFQLGIPLQAWVKETDGTTTTAADGTFSIRGKTGDLLKIKSITKPGYRFITSFEQEQDMQMFYYSQQVASLYQPDPAKPATFPLRHDGSNAKVTACRGGSEILFGGKLQVNQPFIVHEEERK